MLTPSDAGSPSLEDYLAFGVALAQAAGTIMREQFQFGVAFEQKADSTPVTATDLAINDLVIHTVREAWPTHAVLGEEGSAGVAGNMTWVVDPIDGTMPYTAGIPTSTFSLALVVAGEPAVAVVYDPFCRRLFTAIRGGGAWVTIDDGARSQLQVASSGSLGVVDLEIWPGGPQYPGIKDAMHAAGYKPVAGFSVVYSAMMVAAGKFDGIIFNRHYPWDAAAATLIVREAGGITSDLDGDAQAYDKDIAGFVATSAESNSDILGLLAKTRD